MARTVCWSPTWNPSREGLGLEYLVLSDRIADSVVLAVDEDDVPFRLSYRLCWDHSCRLREADLVVLTGGLAGSLNLRADGEGHWRHADGRHISELDGCVDIDIWPTPFTNSFPIWRVPMAIGQRQKFRMAWISAPALIVEAKAQAYSRLQDRLYLFESLDGSGFVAKLPVDEDGLVLDYPKLFRRVAPYSERAVRVDA
jgi:hypothetical protein